MSRAFIKEDVDPPERSGRKRSASGLPPGATNYITARGATRLRDELDKLRGAKVKNDRVGELEQILVSIQVIAPPETASNSVTVGVDELDFESKAVSWISPIGKALLASDIGDWITLDDGRSAKIVKIEYR